MCQGTTYVGRYYPVTRAPPALLKGKETKCVWKFTDRKVMEEQGFVNVWEERWQQLEG